MPTHWSINCEWEALDAGSAEERACFAAVGIQAHSIWLTEGLDLLSNSIRKSPRLSGYHLAEWIAWNWWRLRWEPRSTIVREWATSHRLSTIGGGYIWPNITVFSDGERIALIANPTEERQQTPFRYVSDIAVVIQASEFETEIDRFVDLVLERLSANDIDKCNLRTIWESVFELARILGDRVARQKSSRLFPATRSYTYRQKLQRAFAAEFLSPFDVVDEMLAGDYSMENQQEVADHFDVSPMTIRTLLVNHKRIERDGFDFDVAAA